MILITIWQIHGSRGAHNIRREVNAVLLNAVPAVFPKLLDFIGFSGPVISLNYKFDRGNRGFQENWAVSHLTSASPERIMTFEYYYLFNQSLSRPMAPAPKACPIEQENKILQAAADCISETSLMEFTMSEIARKAGMSMGSIYKHIHCKEDVLVALALRSAECRLGVFRAILTNDELTLPQKLMSINLLDFSKIHQYSFTQPLEVLINSDLVLRRASNQWLQKVAQLMSDTNKLFTDEIMRAMGQGELIAEGDPEDYAQQLNLGVWAMAVGHIHVSLARQGLYSQLQGNTGETITANTVRQGISDPGILNFQRMLNGFQWREPLDEPGIAKAAKMMTQMGYR